MLMLECGNVFLLKSDPYQYESKILLHKGGHWIFQESFSLSTTAPVDVERVNWSDLQLQACICKIQAVSLSGTCKHPFILYQLSFP